MNVRRMTEEDIVTAASLEKACFSRPWSENTLRESFLDPHYVFFAAEDEDGTMVGYTGMIVVLDEADVANVAVFPECRRKGAGNALVLAMLAYARENSITRLVLEVRVSNAPAIALYEKHGFTKIGLRKGYYEDPTEDAGIYGVEVC